MKNNQINRHPVGFLPEYPRWNPTMLRDINSTPSTLPEILINSYLITRYQVWIDTALVTLRAGYPSAPLAALLQATDTRSAVYATACNPGSQIVSPGENQSAMARLYEKLACCSNHIYRGAAIDPAGKWPAEESLLALGIDLPVAKSTGREFEQNATIWIDSAAIPWLVLLR